jgi:hypothetical protein
MADKIEYWVRRLAAQPTPTPTNARRHRTKGAS